MAKARTSRSKKRSSAGRPSRSVSTSLKQSSNKAPGLRGKGLILFVCLAVTAFGAAIWALRNNVQHASKHPSTNSDRSNSLATMSVGELETLLKLPAALPENSIESIDNEAWTARVDAALDELRATLAGDAQALHLIGLVNLKLKRTKQAEPSLKRAVDLASDNQEMRLDLADCLVQLGRDDEALQVLTQAIKPPLTVQYLMKLGDCQLRLGQIDEALATYTSVTQSDDKLADAWIKLGKAQLQKQLTVEGERSARAATQLLPESADAWTLFGRTLAMQKKTEEAKVAMARAGELNAKDSAREPIPFEVAHARSMSKVYGSAFRSLAILFESKGNPDKAVRMFQQSLQADPDDWVALGKWAALLRKLGDFDQAAQLHKRLIVQQPLEAAHYQNLANMSMELNRPRDAEAVLRLACLKMPTSGNSHLLLARFLLFLNKTSEAAIEAQLAFDILKTEEAAQVLRQARH